MGNLNQGEYLIVPNEYAGFRNGNLSNYSKDPVDAIIDICSYEDSGWNRRNVYTYDYDVNFDSNEQKSGLMFM